jgi:hypothetical protein
MTARWIRLRFSGELDFEEAAVRLAVAQPREASPIVLWGEARAEYRFALLAPLRLAPGKRGRWAAWGLAPAVAAYRQFGLAAYLEQDDIWLHGRRIAQSVVDAVGECALVASSLLMHFPAKCVATPSAEFEQAFRLRLEAQHGWTFEHSWPSERELLSYAVA